MPNMNFLNPAMIAAAQALTQGNWNMLNLPQSQGQGNYNVSCYNNNSYNNNKDISNKINLA